MKKKYDEYPQQEKRQQKLLHFLKIFTARNISKIKFTLSSPRAPLSTRNVQLI